MIDVFVMCLSLCSCVTVCAHLECMIRLSTLGGKTCLCSLLYTLFGIVPQVGDNLVGLKKG